MTTKEEKALGIWYILFFGFLLGYLVGILLCKSMPEKYGIVPKEPECSCSCCGGSNDDG